MTHLALSETVPDEKGPTVTWGHTSPTPSTALLTTLHQEPGPRT
jgi:hypothetical protein